MQDLDQREWLLTNGLGSFASGTVCDARSRIYHGWLIAALNPPSERTLLLSHIEASVEVAGQVWQCGTNFWVGGEIVPRGDRWFRSFTIDPVPTWVWGENQWQLTRRLVMPNHFAQPSGDFHQSVWIEYTYQGTEAATLKLRPLIGDRNFHHQQLADPDCRFSQSLGNQAVGFQAIRPGWRGTPWSLGWSAGQYETTGVWYRNYYLPVEHQRGLGDREDLYNPGQLSVKLQPGEKVVLIAQLVSEKTFPDWEIHTAINGYNFDFDAVVHREQQRLEQLFSPLLIQDSPVKFPEKNSDITPLWKHLLFGSDRFIVHRSSVASPTVIAGYHWFNDWGRDTLIALPGLALSTKRFDLAKGLLQTFSHHCRDGLIPNTFPDIGSEPLYNSIDAVLWWIEVLGLYLEATQDWDFLVAQYPIVRQIYKAFTAGTHYNICIDAIDGLVTWESPGVAITWMDAAIDGQPITPRQGKPIEINALWYSALCWLHQWALYLAKHANHNQLKYENQAYRYLQQSERVKASLQKFWNSESGYFFDTIAPDDSRDPKIRPNAVIALSLYHCGMNPAQARQGLQLARDRLLTPYGLRSLDPNDPDYIGIYSGDRIHRDHAYHQGTVWSWLIGPFIRAWQRFYPEQPLPFDWQPLLQHLQEQACIGSVSEIFDGDAPHTPQGAIAQAWSVAELIRHWPYQPVE